MSRRDVPTEAYPADTGCPQATQALGRPSKCVECPFDVCIHHETPAVCAHGHPQTPENTLYHNSGRTRCRTCKNLRDQEYRARSKA